MAQYNDENEWYTDFINNYGIDAEGKRNEAIEANQKAYNDGLTAVQRIYDRSAAGYGATAEMLRQNGLNNSGLAMFYQGIAEQNARQSRSDLYGSYTETSKDIQKQYEADVKANKQDFALHKQGVQSQANTYAMQNPLATEDELYAMALGMGADEITARQMAQNAYAYGEGARNRYIEGQYQESYNDAFKYIDQIAASGGTLNAEAIAKLYPNLDAETIQGIVTERIGNYKDTYVNKWATDLANKIVGEGYSTEGKTSEQIAEELGIPAEYVDDVIKSANDAVTEYNESVTNAAKSNASAFIDENGLTADDITEDVIKQFADANGISTDAAKNALLSAAQTSDQQYADAKSAIEQYIASGEEIASFQDIVNFGKENGYNISTEEAKRMWNEFVGESAFSQDVTTMDVTDDITDDNVKALSSQYGISEDVIRSYLEAEKAKTDKGKDVAWTLYETYGEFFNKPSDIKAAFEKYNIANDFTDGEIREIYNYYVSMYYKKRDEEKAEEEEEEEKNSSDNSERLVPKKPSSPFNAYADWAKKQNAEIAETAKSIYSDISKGNKRLVKQAKKAGKAMKNFFGFN